MRPTYVVLATAGLSACHQVSQPAQPPPSSVATPSGDPVRAAEAALRDDAPIDYELPFADKHERREHRVHTMVRACEAGYQSACWKAMQIAPVAEQPPLVKRVGDNCRAGDILSCRALPVSSEQRFTDLPGAAGRSASCETQDPACDRVATRAECARGFPQSCFALSELKPREPDHRALSDRIESISETGCRAWILQECKWSTSDAANQTFRQMQACELSFRCDHYGNSLREQGQLIAARDAYERACQYEEDDKFRCLVLAEGYLDHRDPEPVLGRGQALLDWVCLKLSKTIDKNRSILDMLPQCKRMTSHP
ncbi:hypothetical protein BH11MYX3_BH11MYX3_27430 [soil metagenome]